MGQRRDVLAQADRARASGVEGFPSLAGEPARRWRSLAERLGPYEIMEPIGAGGMGEVYKARDTRLDRM